MYQFQYDKNELKESLTIDQVMSLVAELGGEPQLLGDTIVSKTICHNHAGEGSHKLYYYDNTKLFRCYTNCGEAFDIYELVRKSKTIQGPPQPKWTREGTVYVDEWDLPFAIKFVANYFGVQANESFSHDELEDWKVLNNYDRISSIDEKTQIVELKVFDDKILKNLPKPIIQPWIQEGISQEVMKNSGIAYNPKTGGIVIPHFDKDNNLIGIRERTLLKEEESRGKYRPSILNHQQYNHPLSFNLYNLNKSKDNIKNYGTAIVFEGEKSPLLYASYFGEENDISSASCGSSLIAYQVQLLIAQGAKEIAVAYDKQFKEIGDDEFQKLKRNLESMHKKYGGYAKISFLFDKGNLLGYKDSPIDRGPDVFIQLWKNRIIL